jgi:GTPase SAR1 family protein
LAEFQFLLGLAVIFTTIQSYHLLSGLVLLMRYAVLVTCPAGAGKTTFSNSFLTHLRTSRRTGNLVNLDPAVNAESFEYEPVIDIKDLVSLDDVMGELGFGPNGGLVYCFE